MADDFQTGAELEVSVSQSSLRDARRTIEQELGDLEVDVIAHAEGGGGGAVGSGGPEPAIIDLNRRQLGQLEQMNEGLVGEENSRERRRRRREFRWNRQQLELSQERNELLGEIKEETGGGGGIISQVLGGGGKGVGGAIGGGLGTTALGIGAGIGIGGLGLGAGIGLATGNIQLPEESIELTLGDITLEPTFESVMVTLGPEQVAIQPQLGPESFNIQLGQDAFEFSPVFDPSMFDIQVQIGEDVFDFSPVFEPEFSPSFEPEFSPSFEPSLDISADLRANLEISPSFTFAPTLNLTGVDLGGLADDVEQAVLDSREFRNEVETISGNVVDDLVDAINRQTGLNLNL